ncbi:MAG: Acetyltransferase domain [Clostridiales bacterium]|jgi:ribosomal protein S18 acetylase RimI-like enzyme|nr:Acetyltransferase domain [Clostridiales bacterium]
MEPNIDYKIKYIDNEEKLKPVLELCYNLLGQQSREIENYTYDAWKNRISKWSNVLIYAEFDGKVISAVLGRPENNDSLVMGFVACDEKFRNQGITRSLVNDFENNAKMLGFKYITLGARPNANNFYEKCGYIEIDEMYGQKIYKKIL